MVGRNDIYEVGDYVDKGFVEAINQVLEKLNVDDCIWRMISNTINHDCSDEVNYYFFPDNAPIRAGWDNKYQTLDIIRIRKIVYGETKHKFLSGHIITRLPELHYDSLREGKDLQMLQLRTEDWHELCYPIVWYNGYDEKQKKRKYRLALSSIPYASKADVVDLQVLIDEEYKQKKLAEEAKKAEQKKKEDEEEQRRSRVIEGFIDDIWKR